MFKNAFARIAVAALIVVSANAVATTTSKLNTATKAGSAAVAKVNYADASICTNPAHCTGGNVVANNR